MNLVELKKFGEALQYEISRCKNTEALNPGELKNETIESLLKEREKYKQLAIMERKKLDDALIVQEA
eukprot:CAMPEP_0170554722 /NCGR_PEP_ID=MMETSP0211-20121228/12597_1 /TAXON_ID=311385 /ORGANISM="Pseudokeronopsis sp., Strain OXSARD2" /LENGTH=66 /DNA_ID=CAMNT_0010864025 /DNA_START=2287 /DNA_END=2487 /DNA_ORIENTATION=-